MGEGNQEEFGAALEGREPLAALLETETEGLKAASADLLAEAMRPHLSEADVAALTGELAAFLFGGFMRGLGPGIDGWLDDDLAFVAPWGFDVAAIGVPVLVWQGDQDLMVPAAHGDWLRGRIPGAEGGVEPGEGHLTLFANRVADVHGWLAERLVEAAGYAARPMFSKVLVANRGEIAVRVIRALDELGIASVAVYSEADRDAQHVKRATEAYLLGPGPATESYLNVDKIMEVIEASGAEAVHPGYGFLAENAAFAKRLEDSKVTFIGPPSSAIEAMGSKTRARELMQKAGVPIVPGTTDPVETIEDAEKIAEEIGYPIAVKAAGGGGGKGFRVALEKDKLKDAFEGAAREGEKFFSDDTVYLERYLPDPRHVEVQVLADKHGTVVHLGERDCSIQRRHQKLIEESPAPLVDEELREKIGKIATDAAEAVGYTAPARSRACSRTASTSSWR